MTDGVNVDFGLLKSPDYVGDYANAFQVGRQMAQPAPAIPASVNALAPASPGPKTPGPDALAGPLGALDGAGRARAAREAELLVNLGTGLRAYPYGQRASILSHLTPALAARGVAPEAIARFDPTDEALEGVIGAARSLGARLAGQVPKA
jgi:hypothetical protein